MWWLWRRRAAVIKDEQEAARWNLAFFAFATSFRRQKLIDEIAGPLPVMADPERYQAFKTLFHIPVLPSSLQDPWALQRLREEALKKKRARADEVKRASAALALEGEARRRRVQSAHASKFARGHLPAFHMHPGFVPRKELGLFEGGHWRVDRSQNKVDTVTGAAWDLLKDRSVRLETRCKVAARAHARAVIGTNVKDVDNLVPRRPSDAAQRRASAGLASRKASSSPRRVSAQQQA